MRGRTLQAILGAAAVAGTLDLASIFALLAPRGIGPERILQSVASGWLGKSGAAARGAEAAAIGFASHYGIMLVFAAFYILTADLWSLPRRRPWLAGALYGLGTFFVMNYIVVPYSAAARWPHWDPVMLAHALVVHVVFVGLVIAWYARGVRG